MNVVDSSAWLEYFADGPNAAHFAAPIEVPADLVVPSITLLEVFRRILQQRTENDAIRAVALMQQSPVIDLDAALAISAAKIGLEERLPLADSIILATARRFGATLWTMVADFAGKALVRYFPKR